jgi:hypothetical protein
LAGATLRRGGVLAGMRCQIPPPERITSFLPEEGFVVVKLFNLLIPELGPLFLQRGILVPPEEFPEIRKSVPDEFWRGAKEEKVEGREGGGIQLPNLDGLSPTEWIWLSVHLRP